MSETISLRRDDLALLVSAFVPPAPLRVLELGYGKGQNAKFFAQRGDDYTGLDRAQNVRPLYLKYGRFLVGDYCQAVPTGFDLIVERGTFVCNPDESLELAVKNIYEALNPRGLFISADLFMVGNPRIAPGLRTFTLEGVRRLFVAFETIHLADTKALRRLDFVGRKKS